MMPECRETEYWAPPVIKASRHRQWDLPRVQKPSLHAHRMLMVTHHNRYTKLSRRYCPCCRARDRGLQDCLLKGPVSRREDPETDTVEYDWQQQQTYNAKASSIRIGFEAARSGGGITAGCPFGLRPGMPT